MGSTRSSTNQDEPAATLGASTRRVFALVAGLVVVYGILDVVAQLLPPHYSPITQAESDLAVGPFGGIMTANFVVRGVLSLAFILGIRRLGRGVPGGATAVRSGTWFFGIWSVGALLLAAFPTDVPATPITGHGAIHLVVALLAFFGGAVGVFAFADHFEKLPALRAAKPWAFPFSWLVVVLFVVELGTGFLVPRWGDRFGGLTERLFLGSVLAWVFEVSTWLAFRTPEADRPNGT